MKKVLLWSSVFIVLILSLMISADLYGKFNHSGSILVTLELGLVIVFVLLIVSWLYLSFRNRLLIQRMYQSIRRKSYSRFLLIISVLVFLETFQDLLLLYSDVPAIHFRNYRILFMNHFSFLVWLVMVSLFSSVFLGFTLFPELSSGFNQLLNKPVIWITMVVIGLIIIINSFTRYGFQRIVPGGGIFLPSNAPLPGIHVFLVVITAMILWKIIQLGSKKIWDPTQTKRQDILIIILIFVITFSIWALTPIDPNPMMGIGRPPNYENYPVSDALYYSIQADRVLVGEGFEDTVEHPMYAMLVGVIKLFSGPDLQRIILIQLGFLSFIPVVIYLLVAEIQSKFTGFLVASLFIIQEHNSIVLSEIITVSNVKMLMTESITLLCLLVFLLIIILWVKRIGNNLLLPFLAGGLFGYMLLIRFEILIILPFLLLGLLVTFRDNFRKWFRGVIGLSAALLLMIAPMMIRNWQKTGLVYVDKYESSLTFYNRLYEFFSPDQDELNNYPDPSILNLPQPFNSSDLNPASPKLAVVDNISEYQHLTISKRDRFLNHLLNNLQQSILHLPSNHQPLLTIGSFIPVTGHSEKQDQPSNGIFSDPYLERYVRSLPYWWPDWDSTLALRSIIPVFISGLFISVGVSSSFRNHKTLTAVLILTFLVYIIAYSLYGRSGGRTIALVNWIPLFFYGIGLSEGIVFILGKFSLLKKQVVLFEDQGNQIFNNTEINCPVRSSLIAAGFTVLIIGISLPVFEQSFEKRFTESSFDDRVKYLAELENVTISAANLCPGDDESVDQPCVLYGKALYPRYFKAGDRMEDDRQGRLPDNSYHRLEFYLTGLENTWVAVPGKLTEVNFPNESEVVLIGMYKKEQKTNSLEYLYDRYFKVSQIYVLSNQDNPQLRESFSCQGSFCDEVILP